MNVLVLGKGFISDHLPYKKYDKHIPVDELTIEEKIIDKYRPDIIINCIGRTGSPNVDWCENNKIETVESNISIPLLLASVTEKYGIKLIHLGSGCIYYGRSPHATNQLMPNENGTYIDEFTNKKLSPTWIEPGWKETDFANPVSFYSKTKYACDLALAPMDHVTILRLRMPISPMNSSRNLLSKLIQYSKVLEEPNSVTFTEDLVNAIDWVIKNNKTGIYHVTSPQPLTHSMLLDEYKKYVPNHQYEKISKKELNKMVVATRSNCILDSSKIINEGFVFTDVHTSIYKCVKSFVENKKL